MNLNTIWTKWLAALGMGLFGVGIGSASGANPGPAGGIWPLLFMGLSMAFFPALLWIHVLSWLVLLLCLWWLERNRSETPPGLWSGLLFGAVSLVFLNTFGNFGALYAAGIAFGVAIALDLRNEMAFNRSGKFYGTVLETRDLSRAHLASQALKRAGISVHVRGQYSARLKRGFALEEPLEVMVFGEDLEIAEGIVNKT